MKNEQDVQLYNGTGLTPHMEDYMEAIIILSSKNKVVRVKDIARELKIKMPSVTAALAKLKEMKLIDYEKYGYIELTETGKEVAERVYSRHACISSLLEDVMLIPRGMANDEACRMEHHVSPETCRQFHKLLLFFRIEEKEKREWVSRCKKFLAEELHSGSTYDPETLPPGCS